MVSAGAQLILDECTARDATFADLADYAVIRSNDTHPTMRFGTDPSSCRRDTDMDEAIEVVSKTCACKPYNPCRGIGKMACILPEEGSSAVDADHRSVRMIK